MFINGIEYVTVREMAERLKIKPSAVKVRLHVAGETPVSKDALYSIKSFNAIKDAPGKGRPKKTALNKV
jgi:predicted ArsR family transcriptional regulator